MYSGRILSTCGMTNCSFVPQMDADYDPSMQTQQPRNRKKRSSKLTRALNQQKPLFDPSKDKTSCCLWMLYDIVGQS